MVAEGGEGENPLPFSLTAKTGGVGVRVGRFPPGPHLRSSRFSRHPRLRQAFTWRFAKNRNLRGLVVFVGPRPLGGPGPKPWRPVWGALDMRGGAPVFAPAFQPLGRAPSSWRPGQLSPASAASRVKNSKNALVLIGS